MTVASNSIILATMREQNQQTLKVEMLKIQQLTVCYNLKHYTNKKICNKEAQNGNILAKIKDTNTQFTTVP